MMAPSGRPKPAGVFNAVREGSRKVREPAEVQGSPVILTCHSAAARIGSTASRRLEPPSDSVAFADLPHPLDLALNDLGLADVPPRVEAPRDESQRVLGDRFGVRGIRPDADDPYRPRGRRVQVAGKPEIGRAHV